MEHYAELRGHSLIVIFIYISNYFDYPTKEIMHRKTSIIRADWDCYNLGQSETWLEENYKSRYLFFRRS